MKHILPRLLCVLLLMTGVARTTMMGQSSTSAATPAASGGSDLKPLGAQGGIAMIPNKISYQGLLTTASGAPATDGSYDLTFELFPTPSGGVALWTEAQTGVGVQKGTFNVLLGSVTPLAQIFSQPLFLQVTATAGPGIGGPVAFSPRNELASAAYSLGPWMTTNTGTYFVPTDIKIGLGVTVPASYTPLDISTSTNAFVRSKSTTGWAGFMADKNSAFDNNYLVLRTGGQDRWVLGTIGDENFRLRYWPDSKDALFAKTTGEVGIGTTDPSSPLHVYGGADPLVKIDAPGGSQSVLAFLTAGVQKWGWYVPSGGPNLSLWHYQSPFQNYITFSGTNGGVYIAPSSGTVGVGTTTPLTTTKFDVESNNRFAGYFSSDSLSSTASVVYGEFIGSGNYDADGVRGESTPAAGFGYGGYFMGGYRGAYGFGNGGAYTGGVTGIYGVATGSAGTRYGVYGTASGGTTNYAVYAAGDLAYTGSLINASDKNLKDNIQSLSSTLSKIMQVQSRSFNFKSTGEYAPMNLSSGTHYGFIAQELEQVFPELIVDAVQPADAAGDKTRSTEMRYKGVKYMEMVPLLVKAIQEQQQMIENQQKQIDELKAQISQNNK